MHGQRFVRAELNSVAYLGKLQGRVPIRNVYIVSIGVVSLSSLWASSEARL